MSPKQNEKCVIVAGVYAAEQSISPREAVRGGVYPIILGFRSNSEPFFLQPYRSRLGSAKGHACFGRHEYFDK